ncbi:xylanolytic transcriptional activator xlnR [Colletotrichum sp. SAR 10_66]|nr:xylanolytic transcriptional activator xlnR [Colletotrichum sp. SAR 10_66]
MAHKPPKKPLKLITASSHDGLRSLDAGAKWDEVEDLMSPGTAAALVVIANPSSWGDSPLNIQTRVYEIEETYPSLMGKGYSEPARPNELSPTAVQNHQFSTQPRQQSFTAGISDMRQMAPRPPASQPVANAADAAELAKIEVDYYNALDRWEKIMQSAVAAEGELLRLEHHGVALRAALDPSAPAPPAPWDTAVASGVLPIPFNLAGSAKQKRNRQRTRNRGGGPAVEEDVL